MINNPVQVILPFERNVLNETGFVNKKKMTIGVLQ